jgi:4a-hydroxytetrahydrobiopterin dehydratase
MVVATGEVKMSSDLAGRECVPCTVGTPPMSTRERDRYLAQLGRGWRVVNDHHLEKEIEVPTFRKALAFANAVGEVAEAAGHHPDIFLSYDKVRLSVFTHKIDGLSEADFVLAAKIDQLPEL